MNIMWESKGRLFKAEMKSVLSSQLFWNFLSLMSLCCTADILAMRFFKNYK